MRWDPLSSPTLEDPYPVYAALREAAPVSWHEEMGCWVVTRYADCVRVLRDPEVFARDRRRLGQPVAPAALSVQSLDPPDQAPVRSLFLNALRARDSAQLEAYARCTVSRLLAELSGRSAFDVPADLAAPLSLAVICDLLGVEQPDHAEFAAVSEAIMRSMDAGLRPDTIAPGNQAREQLTDLVAGWFTDRPRAGLLAEVMSRREVAGVAEVWVRNTARVMFQGGYSTMVAAIGNIVHTLLRHPDALEVLRDPAAVAAGVEELVRFDGPVQGSSRIATTDTQIADVAVRRGQVVLTVFAAANRDPAQFPTPDQLVLDRAPNRHLGFGWGPHACLGALPAQIALRALVSVLPGFPATLRPAGPANRQDTATMRALARLPVTFQP